MNISDYVLSIDNFNNPKELTNMNAIVHLISKLLLLTPGSIQSFPNMGIGLVSNWRYMTESDINKLKQTIDEQISTYLPFLGDTDSYLRLDSATKVLHVSLNIRGHIITLSSDLESDQIVLDNIL